ncbi:helix-turn-helix domain-containing protein [Chryseobacterium sp. A321]
MARTTNNLNNTNTSEAYLQKYICQFIASKFLVDLKDDNGKTISQNEYAKLCGLSSSTMTKIKSTNGYDIPLSTLYKICRQENISLGDLLKEFEEKYGTNLPD